MKTLATELSIAPLHRFADWPNKSIPFVAAGVYAIYDNDNRFLYAGMAGASLTPSRTAELLAIKGRYSGLYDRLNSHASGYRSGDRFNIYICDLFVLKNLSSQQIEAISTSNLSLDSLNKTYIRNELSYRYLVTDYSVARELEDYIQRNGIDECKPFINPK